MQNLFEWGEYLSTSALIPDAYTGFGVLLKTLSLGCFKTSFSSVLGVYQMPRLIFFP